MKYAPPNTILVKVPCIDIQGNGIAKFYREDIIPLDPEKDVDSKYYSDEDFDLPTEDDEDEDDVYDDEDDEDEDDLCYTNEDFLEDPAYDSSKQLKNPFGDTCSLAEVFGNVIKFDGVSKEKHENKYWESSLKPSPLKKTERKSNRVSSNKKVKKSKKVSSRKKQKLRRNSWGQFCS